MSFTSTVYSKHRKKMSSFNNLGNMLFLYIYLSKSMYMWIVHWTSWCDEKPMTEITLLRWISQSQ